MAGRKKEPMGLLRAESFRSSYHHKCFKEILLKFFPTIMSSQKLQKTNTKILLQTLYTTQILPTL